MGFLDHSTNNVILDAVLTDEGRKRLSEGAGTFSIVKFAFADDEVDYKIIQEFGRTVGKEKIEKLTPVLEASTTGYLGLKYRNLSLNNNTLSILPTIKLSSVLEDDKVTLNRSSASGETSAAISIKQSVPSGVSLDSDLIDFSYKVMMDHTFLSIAGAVPDTVDTSNVATYTINANRSLASDNTSSVTISLSANRVSADIFNTFSHTSGGSDVVSRVVKVSGNNSGQFLSFNVEVL